MNEEIKFDAARYARWLQAARAKSSPYLSMTALSNKVGVSKQRISQLEGGDKPFQPEAPSQPALSLVEAIARALNANVDEARIEAGYSKMKNGDDETFEILDGVRLSFHGAANWSEEERLKAFDAVKTVVIGIKARGKTEQAEK